MNLMSWSRELGVKEAYLRYRLKHYSVETAFEMSIEKCHEKSVAPSLRLAPLSISETYKFRVRNQYKYKLERITKCGAGLLALFRVVGCTALESFTVAQLMDEGYRMPEEKGDKTA